MRQVDRNGLSLCSVLLGKTHLWLWRSFLLGCAYTKHGLFISFSHHFEMKTAFRRTSQPC